KQRTGRLVCDPRPIFCRGPLLPVVNSILDFSNSDRPAAPCCGPAKRPNDPRDPHHARARPHAATLDSAALPVALRTPEIERAMEELIVLSQRSEEHTS